MSEAGEVYKKSSLFLYFSGRIAYLRVTILFSFWNTFYIVLLYCFDRGTLSRLSVVLLGQLSCLVISEK